MLFVKLLFNNSEYLKFVDLDPYVYVYLGTTETAENLVYLNYLNMWHVIFTNVELQSTEVNGSYEFKSNPASILPLLSSNSKIISNIISNNFLNFV